MKPVEDDSKFLSSWRYLELARYVPSLKRVIREKSGDKPLIVSYEEALEYAAKNNNTRDIHLCMVV